MPLEATSVSELENRLANSAGPSARLDKEYRWMIVLGKKPVGTVSGTHISWKMLTAEIGYLVAPKWRRLGIATQAVSMVVDALFRAGIQRVHAMVGADNFASKRVVQKLGHKCQDIIDVTRRY